MKAQTKETKLKSRIPNFDALWEGAMLYGVHCHITAGLMKSILKKFTQTIISQ